MKKNILFLSFLVFIQADPLCAMHRKGCRGHQSLGHHTSASLLAPSLVTLTLLLALATPAEGWCTDSSQACYEQQAREGIERRRRDDEIAERSRRRAPDFGPFGGEAYAQGVGLQNAERNRMDAQMHHWNDQINHYQHLGHLQGQR